MTNHSVQSMISQVASLLLVLCLATTSVQACSSKDGAGKKGATSTDPSYDSDSDTVEIARNTGVIRFRRDADAEEELSTVAARFLSNSEVFANLDLDWDDHLTIVEWALEGGSVKDFWALMTKHDANDDEAISRTEFEPIRVRSRENIA